MQFSLVYANRAFRPKNGLFGQKLIVFRSKYAVFSFIIHGFCSKNGKKLLYGVKE